MLEKIQQTQTFINLEAFRQKIYSTKKEVDLLAHLFEVAKNRGFDYMVQTQHPNTVEINIIKELLS